MSIRTEFEEIEEITRRTLGNLLAFSGKVGRPGAELRYACGDLAGRTAVYLRDGSFANRLRSCFRLATMAGITLDWMDRVLLQLTEEQPKFFTSTSVVQNSLIFALAQEGRIIGATEYKSRNEVDATMRRMKDRFDTIRFILADTMSGPSYQDFINLIAAITRYLTDSARPLPRMLHYQLGTTYPALAASQYIYGEGDRGEELRRENKIVHPAFMQRSLRALSA